MSKYFDMQEEADRILSGKPAETTASLNKKRKSELQRMCHLFGLPTDGSKAELISRLLLNSDLEPLEAVSEIIFVKKENNDKTTGTVRGERV